MKGICLRGQVGLGSGARAADHRGQHLRRHLVRQELERTGQRPRLHQGRPTSTSNLVQKHGEVGAAQSGFTECLTDLEQGKVAMWYDATSAAGSLEAKGSPVAGKIGYAPAPVVQTKTSGWLYAWSWAIEKASDHQSKAWKFVSWASSKAYENLVGQQARLGQRPGRQAGVDVLEPALPEDRGGVRQTDADRDPDRRTRRIRASSRGRRSASSSSTSPSSPDSARAVSQSDQLGHRRQAIGQERAGQGQSLASACRQDLQEVTGGRRR